MVPILTLLAGVHCGSVLVELKSLVSGAKAENEGAVCVLLPPPAAVTGPLTHPGRPAGRGGAGRGAECWGWGRVPSQSDYHPY